MKRIKIVLLVSILFLLPLSLVSKEITNRLFVKTFDAEAGISTELLEKFRSRLELYFFEVGAGKYRILSESNIKIMYQQTEDLLKTGCNAEECLMQIANLIDADIIVYGKMKESAAQIHVFVQSLLRDRKTDKLSKASIISNSFYESQMDWYTKEIVKKLINPRYFIDKRKAPLEIKVEAAPELLKTLELNTNKLKELRFTTDDPALERIIVRLNDIVLKGDDYYKKKDTENAREKYREVIKKMETRIPSDKQRKFAVLKNEVYDRITATHSMELHYILKNGDKYLKKKKYDSAFKKYKSIKKQIDNIEYKPVKSRLDDYKKIAKERKYLVRVAKAKEEVLKGDAYYSDYKFKQAIDSYDKALEYMEELEIKTKRDNIAFSSDIKKKKNIAKKTGVSYFKNQVQSYCDRIKVFHSKGETKKAKEMLVRMYDLFRITKFADSESRNRVDDMERLLELSINEIASLKQEVKVKKIETEVVKREKEAEVERKTREVAAANTLKDLEEILRKVARKWYAKKIIIDLEFGSGHMVNAFLSYKLGLFDLGIGGAYTFSPGQDKDEDKILGKRFNEHYYNFVANVNIPLIKSIFWWLDLKGKIGYEWISIDEWSERGMFLSPGLMLGYHYWFAEFAVPVFFGRIDTVADIQMGVGLRIRFEI